MRFSLPVAALAVLSVTAGCTGDPAPPAAPAPAAAAPVAAVDAAYAPNVSPPTCDAARYPDLVRVGMADPEHVVVFLDRSSTATSTNLAGAYGRALDGLIAPERLAHGTRVDLYTLHDRTTGKATHESVQILAAMPATVSQFVQDQQQACNQAMLAFRASRDSARTVLHRFFETASASEGNANGSDVWGALQVVSEAVQDDPPGRPVRVLFLSDMMHCRAGQRCLESRPPTSAAQAQEWGAADAAEAQKNLMLNVDRLASAQYTVVSGEFADRREYEQIPAYWRAFWGALGVPSSNIVFNP